MHRTSGLTLVEIMIVVSIISVVMAGLVGLFRQTQGAYEIGSSAMALEARGTRIMRRIVSALRAADAATLAPRLAPPLSSSFVDFEVGGGFDGKQTTNSDPRRIRLDAGSGTVSWIDGFGTPDPRELVLTRSTPRWLEGEVVNLADDNGNGLWDEPGLAFCFEGDVLIVRLSLQEERDGGSRLERTWESRITCRN